MKLLEVFTKYINIFNIYVYFRIIFDTIFYVKPML